MTTYKQNKVAVIENDIFFKALSENTNIALIYATIECVSIEFRNVKHFSDKELFTRAFFRLYKAITIDQFWNGVNWLTSNQFYDYTDCISIDIELFQMLKDKNI